jgi:hypothetical protein
MITGTTNLATLKFIPSTGMNQLNGDSCAIQMKSTNLNPSAQEFALDFSLDGTNWDVATENGADVTGTLIKNAVQIIQFDSVPGMIYRLRFTTEEAVTGTVAYVIND